MFTNILCMHQYLCYIFAYVNVFMVVMPLTETGCILVSIYYISVFTWYNKLKKACNIQFSIMCVFYMTPIIMAIDELGCNQCCRGVG